MVRVRAQAQARDGTGSGRKVVYRMEKTEKLIIMSQCICQSPLRIVGWGEREEKKTTQEAGGPKRSVSEREERV